MIRCAARTEVKEPFRAVAYGGFQKVSVLSCVNSGVPAGFTESGIWSRSLHWLRTQFVPTLMKSRVVKRFIITQSLSHDVDYSGTNLHTVFTSLSFKVFEFHLTLQIKHFCFLNNAHNIKKNCTA